jgi:hypothetical protein
VTLYLHEVHHVRGRHEDEFEAAFRDAGGWMQMLGAGGDARLLWYANQAHGTGPAYRVVTVTAVADGAAWERLARSVQHGELQTWARHVDTLRHQVQAKLLLPVSWSPIAELDLASEPAVPADHEPTLFMEDTGWPHSALDDYVDFWERDYFPLLSRQPEATRLLEIQACWVPALGAGRRPEAILWQRVHSHGRLVELLSTEVPAERRAPGTYMDTALDHRDQWESRLLRTAPWSPRS